MRSDLPTGTVTFLFTDVEGSTKLLHELGAEGYAEALAEHRRVIREACTAEGGVEVDTQGDAFFFAFPTAPGALAAAGAMTELLANGPIHVRIGVHTGTPLLSQEGYIGGDVHRAARIAGAGHGGQILVSASTAPLVEVGLRYLGEHRFKDLSAAERVYQLGDGEFPALKSLYRTNLPVPATPFLGRERELAEVVGLLEGTRLLTLTGPGGTGKTRLALQAAAAAAESFPDGVFWVPLAPLRDPSLVLPTASHAVGAKNGLDEHIVDKRLLLVLDNFEQVVEAAPALSDLLSACPNLELVVTSREPLHLGAEQEYAVPPFVHEEGVGFFLAKARAAKPDFQSNEAVSEICRRLDDLPLALELAAARVKALSTKQILDRLERSLPLLIGGSRDLPERQRTLRATIAWSYDLLSEDEQQLFARLAVFRGGCTLDAAEDVANASVDTLQSLVDKSLVRFSNERHWMLETIREYAVERLCELSEHDALRDRHADFFFELAHTAEPELEASDQVLWLDRLERDLDNFRAALDRGQDTGRSEEALRAAVALRRLWDVRVRPDETQRRFERLLAVEQPPELRAMALRDLAQVASSQGDLERAWALVHERLELYRTLGDDVGIHRTLQGLALLAGERGDLEQARALITPVIAWARGVSDWEVTYPLDTLSEIAFREGNYEESRALCLEALAIYERLGDDVGIAGACGGVGWAYLYQGRLEDALPFLNRGFALWRKLGDRRVIGSLLQVIALVAVMRDEARRAALLLGKADSLLEETGGIRSSGPDFPDERVTRAASQALGPEIFQAAYAEGRAMAFDEAVQDAEDTLRNA